MLVRTSRPGLVAVSINPSLYRPTMCLDVEELEALALCCGGACKLWRVEKLPSDSEGCLLAGLLSVCVDGFLAVLSSHRGVRVVHCLDNSCGLMVIVVLSDHDGAETGGAGQGRSSRSGVGSWGWRSPSCCVVLMRYAEAVSVSLALPPACATVSRLKGYTRSICSGVQRERGGLEWRRGHGSVRPPCRAMFVAGSRIIIIVSRTGRRCW